MTYQAPVDDIAAALKTASGLDDKLANGLFPGLDAETIRAVENHQRRMRRGPPEERIHAAAITIRTGAGCPVALGLAKVHDPGRLRWKDAGPADFVVQ